MLELEIRNGQYAGTTLTVSESAYLGRAQDSDMFISDPQVSRKHARVFLFEGAYWVEDNKSQNGTFVNEIRVDKKRVLRNGDVIRIGNTQVEAHLSGETEDPWRLKMEEELTEVTPLPY